MSQTSPFVNRTTEPGLEALILDALPASLAVLDACGTIVRVNESWRVFARANGWRDKDAGVGVNYLELCAPAMNRPSGPSPTPAADGIRMVLAGDISSFEMENPCQGPNDRRWYRLLVSAFVHPDGSRGAVVLHTDISKRHLAEEKLRESEANMAAAQRIGHFGSWEFHLDDAKGRIRWSDEMFRIFGFEPGAVEVTRALFFSMVPEEEHRSIRDGVQGAIETGDPYFAHHRIRRPDGQERILRERGRIFRGPDGQPLKMVGTTHDVTEQARAEAALRASEERFHLAVSGAAAGIWDWNMLTGDLYRSDRYLEILGYARGDLPPMVQSAIDMVHPEDLPRAAAMLEEHLQHRTLFNADIRMRTKSGAYKWLNSRGQAIWDENQRPYRMAGSIADISERKEAEEAIRRHKELLETILDHVPAMIAFLKEGEIIWVNEFCERTLGRPLSDLVGHSLAGIVTKDPGQQASAQAFLTQSSGGWLDLETSLPEGRVLDTSWANVVLSDGSSVAIGQDISERKRAEQWIREQAALLDEAPDAIMVKDLEGRLVFWSQGAERIYGWSAAEAQAGPEGKTARADLARWDELRPEVLRAGQWSGETRETSRTGQSLVLQSRWTLVRDGRGAAKSILIINTDITEKKKLESSFLRAQRMESIGTLAGGIAHDLNNVLAPILLAIAILRERITDPDGRSMMDTLESSAEHGASLVKQVLSFARGVDGSRLSVNPFHLARDVQKIARDTFPKDIRCLLQSAPQLWTVTGDPTQLHQVLLNLCVNARDAMPGGGELRIDLGNIDVDEHYVRTNPEGKAGAYVLCKVSDTGSGIPREIQDKIFEPFFTTKELGKGTGLGLATVLAIVRSHGGFVTVYSEPGRGSTFKVYLPASPDRPAETPGNAPPLPFPSGRGEMILVVDDEESIRLVAKRILERHGYRAMLAKNGAEAVALYGRHRDEIAAILTDMAMPVMDGPATVRALREVNPAVRVIGSSGLSTQTGLALGAGIDFRHFIPKPYTAEGLLKAIRAALDEPPGTGG